MEAETVEKPDRFAPARAAKAAKAAQAEDTRHLVPGRRLTDSQRAKMEEMAAIVPTNADEYRLQANAAARLKLANPGVKVRVVETRRGKYQQLVTHGHGRYEVETRRTEPSTLAISGDDLANVAPGGIGGKFRIGDEAVVTEDAAERLIAQGYVELA